jgi:AhpD family alkylhydroperoxidase
MHPTLNLFALRSLARALSRPDALLFRYLDPKLREKVILRVSAVNSCYVCSLMHQTWAGWLNVTRAEIACVRTKQIDDPRLRVALDFADARTTNDQAAQAQLLPELSQHFSSKERAAIMAFADLFTFTNRFNNTWEGWLPGSAKRRQAMGIDK